MGLLLSGCDSNGNYPEVLTNGKAIKIHTVSVIEQDNLDRGVYCIKHSD